MLDATNQLQRFCKMWAASISSSLASQGVVAPAVTATDAASTLAPSQQQFEKLVCIRFTCSGAAKGELLWVAEKAPALQIARLLTGTAPAGAEPEQLSSEDREAFAKFLSQTAAQTGTSGKAELGSELAFTFQSTVVPAPVTAQCSTFNLIGDNFAALSLRLFLDGELTEALSAIVPSAETAEVSELPGAQLPPASTAPSGTSTLAPRNEPLPANLGLVLDVELEATIRFGDREMLLRDIFGLMAGAVVELNQMVNEPAELHVAGRLVARGEVVVVDGNFGLRVTEVAALHERVAALNL